MSERGNASPKSRGIEGILEYMHENNLTAGDQLPAERELCQMLGVSRTALRAALAALVSQHVLESRPGSGTYVAPVRPIDLIQENYGFSDAVRQAGMTPSSRVISASVEVLSSDQADQLEVPDDSQTFHLHRVRLADGRPVSIEDVRVNYQICPGIETHDFSRESLYQVLGEQYGIVVEHGREKVMVSLLSAREAQQLGVHEGEPVLERDSLALTPDGTSVEWNHSVILPSRYRLASVTYTR